MNVMPNKKLIVFCDGTWNTPEKSSNPGGAYPTNVSKLFRATCPQDVNGVEQIVHYTQGVGTHWYDKWLGGGFGLGISDNIKNGYKFICSNYTPGDEIFLFGFSRGAYTARSLAGLIYNLGIIEREHFDQLDNAYEKYRDKSDEWHPDGSEAVKFRNQFTYEATHGREKIRFLGVWDTVGALGAPYGLILGWLIDKIFKCRFHDTKLSPIIESAFHALAEDEKRWPFRPTLWDWLPTHTLDNFEQRWFTGVHADVGGGYQNSDLADLALEWMAEKAGNHGMATNLSCLTPQPVPLADLYLAKRLKHNSQKFYYRLATLLFVKWPAKLFIDWPGMVFKKWPDLFYKKMNDIGLFAETDIKELISKIKPNGDFERLA